MAELMFCLLLMAVGGLVWNLRDSASPATLWTSGWVILAATSLFVVYGRHISWAGTVSLLTSALLPAFMLAGALVYAERAFPRWLLPGALALGVLRWALAQSEVPLTGLAIGIAAEPGVELAAAWYALLVARRPDATLGQRLLVPALVCLAALDSFTAVSVYRGVAFSTTLGVSWSAVGLVTFGLQIAAAGQWARVLRLQLQRESEQAREALRESEERFAVLAENASDIITEMGEDGRILYSNPGVEHILGRRPEDLIGKVGFDFVHPEDREHTARQLSESLATGERVAALYRCQHADGSWRWIETTNRSFESAAAGRRVVAVSRDVTARQEQQALMERSHESLERRVEDRTQQLRTVIRELEREVEARRRADAELRASRERYRVVSEISSDFSFCFRFDRTGYVETEWVSDAFTRLTGYTIAEVDAGEWRNLVDREHWERAKSELDRVPRGEAVEFEGRIVTKGGETRWLHSRLTGRRLPDSGEVRVVGASRDITDRRQAEEERRKLEAHLNDAQRLDSLGLLAGGVAHDFNNLLSVILGNISLLISDSGEDSEVGRRLARVRSAAQHAARLTEQMLTYSGKAPFSLKPVDLSRVVEGTRDLLEATVSKRSDLVLEVSEAPVSMDGDETQLRQVVLNLVSNAAEALGERSGRVRIRTGVIELGPGEPELAFRTPPPPPGEYVYLEVEDTGPGIDRSSQERIFDPFFTTRRSGRGLGLATVIGIVRGHHGAIALDSSPGRGTRFRVLFPRSSEPTRLEIPSPRASPRAETRAIVLVIDDEEAVLELAGEFLRRAGFDVRTAGGGREGIAVVEREDIDVVVLDLVMPDLDGEETYRQIRALRPGLPVLLTSGYDEERSAERFESEDTIAFLGKPYEPEDLVAKVRAALD